MDNSPYLELSRKLFKTTGLISLAVTEVPGSSDFVLEFPYHHPTNSKKLEFLGLELNKFEPTFKELCRDIFAKYLVFKEGPLEVNEWMTITGRNKWTIYSGPKDSIYFDLTLWIDNLNIGKLFLYTRKNNQNKFREIFDIGVDIYEPLGLALSNLTPKNSAVRCGVYLRAFMAKDSGKLIAVDLALPYASDAVKVGMTFRDNNL